MSKKKLFISVPMKGRSDEAIARSKEDMHKMAELLFGEELDVIDSNVAYVPATTEHEDLYYLGESIKKMANADYFIGIAYSSYFKGCEVEELVARRYGIKTKTVGLDELQSLADALSIEKVYIESLRDQAWPVNN